MANALGQDVVRRVEPYHDIEHRSPLLQCRAPALCEASAPEARVFEYSEAREGEHGAFIQNHGAIGLGCLAPQHRMERGEANQAQEAGPPRARRMPAEI